MGIVLKEKIVERVKQMAKVPNGFYLVMEGTDGCGKTTQYGLLAERLSKDFDVLRIREPGGTPFGDKIRSILLDRANEDLSALTELFLFSASRRHSIETFVIPALAEGKVVLSDRNCYSTEAYQGAGGQVSLDEIRRCNALATAGANLNLAVILDIDSDVALNRARGVSEGRDKIEARASEYHQRVGAAYRTIAKRDSDICVLIDASRSIEDIHEDVYRIAKERIERVLKDA